MAGRTGRPGESMLARVAALLRSFGEDDEELSLGELARRSGLPSSTVHRIVRELTDAGFLARTDCGAYTIGLGLWELGELSPVSARLRERALPHLVALYEASGGENVHLAVLDDGDPERAEALYVARVTGPTSIPTLSRMGGRHPLHTTGVGKALLSTRSDAWLERYFSRPLERETVYSVTSEAELRRELARASARGYATTRQEMTLGNVSIAAPLPGVPGLPPAALGLVAHIARVDERRAAALVIDAAARIGRDLGAA